MKKVLFSMAMFSMVALMAACGGNNETKNDPAADGKTAAEMKCKCQALEGEAADKCNTEADAKYNELKKQYKDDQLNAFEKAFTDFKCDVKDDAKDDENKIEKSTDNDNDAAARMQAIENAAQEICTCAEGDKAKIQECLKTVISTGYTAYSGDEDFSKAVYEKALKCAVEKAATKVVDDFTNRAAEEIANRRR